jgi:5-deoxy-glucuronate isomerase
MSGEIELRLDQQRSILRRGSVFDEGPSALHAAAGQDLELTARSEAAELTRYRTANTKAFPAKVYEPSAVEDEPRGRGLLKEASFRYVRTVFDARNSDPAAELVLGEVVTFPGRWSSYPPHHHPQPEIYHYRFSDPRGFGHAELGETVLKIRHFDTVKILAGVDHPQCAAPGYAMYYSWVIRHLPEARYSVPEFTKEHAWALDPKARFWWPRGVE